MSYKDGLSKNVQCIFLKAYKTGDVQAVRTAADQGVNFLSAMLDHAAIRCDVNCLKVTTRQPLVCVLGYAMEHLVKKCDLDDIQCTTR